MRCRLRGHNALRPSQGRQPSEERLTEVSAGKKSEKPETPKPCDPIGNLYSILGKNMIKRGKQSRIWDRERAKLKIEYEEREITQCEVQITSACTHGIFLGFAHRHKRREYKNRPDLLGSFDQTVLACTNCHTIMEASKEITRKVFERLRPNSTPLI